MRIVVAMSGGVDSSVAAVLLAEQGHDVVGFSMQLYDQRDSPDAWGSCCSLGDLQDARRVANAVGFPHYIVNFEEEFRRAVVDNFVSEYAAGRTPIPCVHCNSGLKFATLVERAAALDAEIVATGHYARVDQDPATGLFRLRRGKDRDKDQSYFLFSLTQDQLSRASFPVGELTKTEVREIAARRGLLVAAKPDSHEICFVPDGDAAGFVARQLDAQRESLKSGKINDTSGKTLGDHAGIHQFTIGQRKGLGLSTGVPLYVVKIDPDDHSVTVGGKSELGRGELTASRVNWIAGAPPAGRIRAAAQIRHRHREAPGWLTPHDAD
ncbi:MAG: tRNA 2-thiouridine(34) synthase MnmA, partial [Acidobacteria bacterium]|nr:tRNA 2-thiouridine(34) synthase MnmA [Acidobacteriota bacterium]